MRRLQTICFSLTIISMLSICLQKANAQPGAFPAFSSTTEQVEPVQGFSFPSSKQPVVEKKSSFDFNQLGLLLAKMGLEPTAVQSRYDFQYRVESDNQAMELSLSAVLEKGDELIRIRAWLDPLPTGKIPSKALLQMLSRNEEMKQGLRFAYSKQTGRFLLEKTVSANQIDSKMLTQSFQEITQSVTENWSVWSTSQWTKSPRRSVSATPAEVISDERFELPIRR